MPVVDDERETAKALSLITIAMISGILIFCIAGFIVYRSSGPFMSGKVWSNEIGLVILVGAAILLTVAASMYKNRMERLLVELGSAREKLEKYRTVLIQHLAICELVAVMGPILFLLQGNFSFFALSAAGLLEVIRKFPARYRIRKVVDSSNFL